MKSGEIIVFSSKFYGNKDMDLRKRVGRLKKDTGRQKKGTWPLFL